jgi:hypothetical protein
VKDSEKVLDEGQSFYNEALTGSGTIQPDGTYGEPQPDPTPVRGLGGFKTSGGRDVEYGGLGDAGVVANRGEPEDVSADSATQHGSKPEANTSQPTKKTGSKP